MAGPKPSHYLLTPAAEADLADIWQYSEGKWGEKQADIYIDGLEATVETLVAMPEIARERTEFKPPIRIHPSAKHSIVYQIENDHLTILRVLAARQNWQALLGE